jgi:Na+/proline symporter
LFKKALRLITVNKRQIAVYFVIFSVLTLLLVRGFESVLDTIGLEDVFTDVVDDQTAGITTAFASFALLLQSSSSASTQVGQLYQLLLIIIGSLSLIWLFRQQQAGQRVTIKEALYKGMYPFIPFVLVGLVMILQLLPLLIGNFLFQQASASDLIINNFELAVWIAFVFFTLLLSLYMLTSSIMALYIVTLPNMTPMVALREARELVRHRRFAIMARIVLLSIAIVLLLFIFVVPVLYFVPVVAEWLFFALSVLAVPVVHAYMFSLYRELL